MNPPTNTDELNTHQTINTITADPNADADANTGVDVDADDNSDTDETKKRKSTPLSIALTPTDRDIIADALDVALALYTIQGRDRTDLTTTRKKLHLDQEVYTLAEWRWNLVSRCLSYEGVREEIGITRAETIQSKLLRWLNDAEVNIDAYKRQ